MSTFLYVLAGLAVAGVVVALAYGLFNFAQEGEKQRRRSNQMMRYRLIFQFVAVIIVLVIVAFAGGR